MFDVAIAGDDETVPMLEREALGKVRDEPDPPTMFRLYGDFLATVAPRDVPVQLVIRDAATAEATPAPCGPNCKPNDSPG